MIPSWFFQLFIYVGLIGAWLTLLFCIYVSVKEYRAGTLWRQRD